MALLDVMRDRAARKGGTAQVDCGELGMLTVEALSPADCDRLSDSRALLYAACRELQKAGEELRREGKIFRPDEIASWLTDNEADAAARTIRELSSLSGIRLSPVQGSEDGFSEIRHQSVQPEAGGLEAGEAIWTNGKGIRLSSVQAPSDFVTEDGQVSHEFSVLPADFEAEPATDKKPQILGELSSRTAQILGAKQVERTQTGNFAATGEIDLHEIESELQRQGRGHLHETESEFRPKALASLHETTSDSGGRRGILLHETESESALVLHEVKSELQKALHEIKSEVGQMLHESKSELAEEAARQLAEALRRAAQVR